MEIDTTTLWLGKILAGVLTFAATWTVGSLIGTTVDWLKKSKEEA